MVRRKAGIVEGDYIKIGDEWVLAYGAIGDKVGKFPWKFGEVRRPVNQAGRALFQIKDEKHDAKTG